jgi:predicted neuraminidase
MSALIPGSARGLESPAIPRARVETAIGRTDPAVVRQEFIFERGPTPACHASTVVETEGGVVAAWFGGTEESAPDVGIWLARSEGSRWSAPERVLTGRMADGKPCACWNPVLFQPRAGPLILFAKVGPDETEWWGEVRTSPDGGRTWSAAHRLREGILGPIKNKPVQLADGTIISPSSTETSRQRLSKTVDVWQVHLEISSDGGQTWTKVGPLADPGGANVIQPTVLVHDDGRLQILCRSQVGRMQEAWSSDQGRTWSALAPAELPNPDAGFDAVKMRDGRFLLVYNHTSKDDGEGRRVLNVAVSRDGRRWDAALVLENEPGEFSYPAVIQSANGQVHVTYTWNRKRIKHAVISPAALTLRPIRDGQWPQ